ncbi:MAG TPA: tRNA guanosine(34) transglycosylase Tgt [Candidatus Saccharimonadales bacterium]|nr:tRNA guanosine(34) transglycosylase Tgt [Candidatus Saccharimonadales bacterium]
MLRELKTKTATLSLPVFFPDATKGVIKSLGAHNLKDCNTDGLVINTYHLMNDDKIELINKFGGIHKFMGYDRPVISDSGGFQVMSLIHNNPKNGKIEEDVISFKIDGSNKKLILTPQSCIETQIKLRTDIIMCLDDCTDPEAPLEEQQKSVERTIRWAKQCKQAFNELTADMAEKPLIFGIIQGGNHKELRKECAEELVKIGFDGYAYGGWPMNSDHQFLSEITAYTASLIPDNFPKYAMGVGKPENITECVAAGYNMFDCVIPTRDARHKRLYVFTDLEKNEYQFIYLGSGKHKHSDEPISKVCDCIACKNYTRGYLYHLFQIQDALSIHLATIHNLRFYSMFMENIRAKY